MTVERGCEHRHPGFMRLEPIGRTAAGALANGFSPRGKPNSSTPTVGGTFRFTAHVNYSRGAGL